MDNSAALSTGRAIFRVLALVRWTPVGAIDMFTDACP